MMRIRWRKHRLFVAWQCGSIAEEMGLEVIRDLGRSPMSGLRQVTLEYPGSGRCLVEVTVEMADDLARVVDALIDVGLTVARSSRGALHALKQAADERVQVFVRISFGANRVIDLLECNPDLLARAAITPSLVKAAGVLGEAYDAIIKLSKSTAAGSIKAHLAWALEEACRALGALPPPSLAHPAENALRPAVARWVGILTEAAAMLEPSEEPDPPGAWRERLARFEREQLGRHRNGAEASGME